MLLTREPKQEGSFTSHLRTPVDSVHLRARYGIHPTLFSELHRYLPCVQGYHLSGFGPEIPGFEANFAGSGLWKKMR